MPLSPTQEEVIKALDVVYFEIQQLASLATHEDANTILNNAVIESRLLHLRNLLDFFEQSAREKDNVLARDYGLRPDRINLPDKYRTRLHKDLAHITYSRISRSEADKAWPYDVVIFPVLDRCRLFIQHVIARRSNYGKFGADSWRQLLEHIERLPSPGVVSTYLSASTSSVQINATESFSSEPTVAKSFVFLQPKKQQPGRHD